MKLGQVYKKFIFSSECLKTTVNFSETANGKKKADTL